MTLCIDQLHPITAYRCLGMRCSGVIFWVNEPCICYLYMFIPSYASDCLWLPEKAIACLSFWMTMMRSTQMALGANSLRPIQAFLYGNTKPFIVTCVITPENTKCQTVCMSYGLPQVMLWNGFNLTQLVTCRTKFIRNHYFNCFFIHSESAHI